MIVLVLSMSLAPGSDGGCAVQGWAGMNHDSQPPRRPVEAPFLVSKVFSFCPAVTHIIYVSACSSPFKEVPVAAPLMSTVMGYQKRLSNVKQGT